jgi:hypothetical protein
MIDGITPPRRPASSGSAPNANRNIPSTLYNTRPEPTFKPPELVAAEDGFVQKLDMPDSGAPNRGTNNKKPGRLKTFLNRFSKKQKIIAGVIAGVILLGSGGAAAFVLTKKDKPVAVAPVAKQEPAPEPPKPTVLPSPLTGVPVAPDLAALPVTGVMIENSPDARPQSGLKQAGVVYEAIAEGGITRFMALFQESQPDYVGPVRSVRPYYLEWVQGYDAAIAHVGGSPEALNMIKSGGIKDLDQFYNSGIYQRVSSRYAPHNVYTALPKLTDTGKAKGFTKSNFTGFSRKEDKPSAAPNAKSIDITMSGFLYNPHFDYDAATNTYKRSMAGKPHVDERSKEQISPKVVVAIVVPFSIASDGVHSVYQTTGSGKAYIYQDGTVVEGIWEKTGSKNGLRLADASGAPLAINTGQTWISVVKTAGSVAHKP